MPSQAGDLHQASSTNGTGIPTALLKHGVPPSPATATKEAPVEAPSPVGSPRLGGTFIRPGRAARTIISAPLLLAGDYPPSPLALPHHAIAIPPLHPALVLMHILVLHARPTGSLMSDKTSPHAHMALVHLNHSQDDQL